MKKTLIAALLISTLWLGLYNQVNAGVSINFNLFFNNLSPYGTWVTLPNYGEVWYPSQVGVSWRPYSRGRWVWTDDGWMWVSYEPWGWATYHYGRWVDDPYYGWVWVPGSVWAPAWVSWYVGPTYIGWAPLPPPGISINVSFFPAAAVFVPFQSFLAVNLYQYSVPSRSNVTIIRNTTVINNITVVNNNVTDPGPNVALVRQRTGVQVRMTRVVSTNRVPTKTAGALTVNQNEGNKIAVFRPNVQPVSRFRTPILNREAERGVVQAGNKRLLVSPLHPIVSHAKPTASPQTSPQQPGRENIQRKPMTRPQVSRQRSGTEKFIEKPMTRPQMQVFSPRPNQERIVQRPNPRPMTYPGQIRPHNAPVPAGHPEGQHDRKSNGHTAKTGGNRHT